MQPFLSQLLGKRVQRFMRRRAVYFSTVRCPHCNRRSRDQMPGNASDYFYQCLHCNTVFKPKSGDCCVYCSYGNTMCPPKQFGAGALRPVRAS